MGPSLFIKQAGVFVAGLFVWVTGTSDGSHDIVAAAFIAGIFTLVNTLLNWRVAAHAQRIRDAADLAAKSLHELAEEKAKKRK